MRDAGGEQVGRGMSAGRDLSGVHSATLLGMLQFVVHEAVAASKGACPRENVYVVTSLDHRLC
jgi:hypothetical protein